MDSKEKQTCNLCSGLVDDMAKNNRKFRVDFQDITDGQDCIKHYVCLPLLRIKKEIKELQDEEMKDITGR